MQNTCTEPLRRVRWGIILAISAAHFVLTLFALFTSFSLSSERFDSPDPGAPSLFFRSLNWLTHVLLFPVVTYWPFPSTLLDYLGFALNSLLWAICIYASGSFISRSMRKYDSA